MDSFSMVAATGFYQFKINHSKTKDMGIGKFIISPKFRVGGHDWAIKYFPQGNREEYNGQYVSVFLELRGESVDVRAAFGFVLLDKHGNVSSPTLKETPHTFTSHGIRWGFSCFLKTTELEDIYIEDDCFVLSVSIAVRDGSHSEPVPHYHPTQSVQNSQTIGNATSMSPTGSPRERIQKFREENRNTDISFDVDGTIFAAHRLILAAHSLVFEAELLGSMAESNMDRININEMMPSVFKAMLDFMYNSSFTINEELINGNDDESMSPLSFIQNLLVAADHYAVEQLKILCEHKLIKCISSNTVFSNLELAEKHNCSELKEECIQFIVNKNNLVLSMFSEGYIKLMQNYPSLLAELKDLAVNEI